MDKVKDFLQENGYDYRPVHLGDMEFNVPAIRVPYYFDGVGNSKAQVKALCRMMQKRKGLVCREFRIGGGWVYEILTCADAEAIDSHCEKQKKKNDAFWKAEHERRLREKC